MDSPILKKDELLRLMSDGKKLTFISAPAGFGKTTAMHVWFEYAGLVPLCVSLSETDNDPLSFYQTMLSFIPPDYQDSGLPDDFEIYSSQIPRFITRLYEHFSEIHVAAFDDFHFIHNEQIIESVASLIKRLPAGYRIFIVSRLEPPIQFEAFRLKDQMTCINEDDLRFQIEDIIRLAEMTGEIFSPDDGAKSFQLTGGWPIAVRAFLNGKKIDGIRDRRLLFDFFEDSIWGNSDNSTKKNILLACIVDILTPELFTALTGEPNGERLLADMCRKNAFFNRIYSGSYRFHSLFREFAQEKMFAAGFSQKEQYLKAARWYEGQDMPYMAVKNYISAGGWNEMAPALHSLFKRTVGNFSVEEHYQNIQCLKLSSLPETVLRKNIYLFVIRAWGFYLGAEPEHLTKDIDTLKELLSGLGDEETFNAAALFCTVDHRKPLLEIVDDLYENGLTFQPVHMAHTVSLSQNLPFFHRSYRDHSDYAEDMDSKLIRMRETLGRFVGSEYEAIENCIGAGILYEKGMLHKALFYASQAVSEIHKGIPTEIAFCACMILAAVLYAMNKNNAADKVVLEIHEDIIRRESRYLLPNLQAFIVNNKLYKGDKKTAFSWLQSDLNGSVKEKLLFYKIYRYFTTAKAFIVVGALDTAILFTGKLIDLCEAYNRPIDVIYARIFRSIALRKNRLRKKADEELATALETAQLYGFIQPFILESADLSAELGRLSHRLSQPDYQGKLDGAFVKALYLATLRSIKQSGDVLRAGEAPLSVRQFELIKLLADGYSYRDISEKTGLKASTVKTYLRTAYQKLGVVNRREAVLKATALGIMKKS